MDEAPMTSDTEEMMARALFKVISPYVREANDNRRFDDVMNQAASAVLTALDQAGLVIVPREPSKAMSRAGCEPVFEAYNLGTINCELTAIATYRAMLSAASGKGE